MECQKPRYLHKIDMVVPCGNCAFCTATRRSDWALRLNIEAKRHATKRFVTLTYADPHLVWKNGTSQLCKRHLQLYFMKLRKAGYKIRYYAVGEYGSKTYRPHYHVIMFGEIPEDVVRQSWIFGQVHIGRVTEASIMYTLGYIVTGKAWQMTSGREKPFAVMSRRPGLGSSYLTPAMVEWHRSGRKNYAIFQGEKRHLPRYYKTKIFSKIDLVRIAVRDQKQMFKKSVEWLRSPAISRLADPLAYRQEQINILAKRIRWKTKEHHHI